MAGSRRVSQTREQRVHGRRGKKKRRRGQIAAVAVVSLLVLLTAGAGWVYLQLNGNLSTFDSGGVSSERPEGGAGGQNVLVIGSDARSRGNKEYGGGREGDVGRSDTAFLLHVYGDRQHAVAVSLPRDTLVEIPPCKLPDGSWTKSQSRGQFNAAFSVGQTQKGNPACTQNTVEKLTGLRVDHTVVVDFKGFARITSAVGGVPVCVPKNLYEKDLSPHRPTQGKLILKQGVQKVAGQKALDYVRIRHGLGDGSDIGRVKRQQAFVGSLIKEVKGHGMSPTKLLPLANAATESMTVDEGLGTPEKMVDFTMSLKGIDLGNTRFVTLPWRYQGSRVAVVEPQAAKLWADLKADRTVDGEDASGKDKGGSGKPRGSSRGSGESSAKVSGEGVHVSVFNGTSTPGLAAAAAKELKKHDFTVEEQGNAASQQQATTSIAYGPDERPYAVNLAKLFPGAELKSSQAPGLSVTLGTTYQPGASPDAGADQNQGQDKGRSAADDPCSGVSGPGVGG
ncbi:LCP family protein [Streptomyces sp. Amel2xB2]|uniref:LCP family protein n=1 Tax=Streptomyces sp. Amel2xB2 TaxID=1305829 RepID=UPI000DBA463A|nr:LCP family protein [Streptomyces sp. Amel2xB2]